MDTFNNDAPRKMFEGNWTCSKCGAAINKLPFQPDEGRLNTLTCVDCHKKRREHREHRGGERRMFEGNWTCSECGKEITQLPFEPRGDKTIKCFDCFKGSRY